jgi:DNA polymerase-4
MDLDAFFVSVECLRDSRLKGIPLIIGGKNGRGVVAACSYEARRFGVHSAMPSRLALQLCPDAMVISGDMEAYTKYSAMVTDIVREEAPLFEKASIDEFYIDITGMDQFFGAFKWARELRRKVIENTQLPISMGLSVNKLVSKVATGEYKPNGEKQVPAGKERDFLAPLSVKKIPMVGEKTSQFLYDMGIHTVGTLRKMPVKMLQSAFGKNGVDLWNKANAIDSSPVVAYSEQKSMSTECTFSTDTINIRRLKSIIIAMVEKLAFKLRKEKKLTACITVKIRYSNFDTETRQVHLAYTSSDQTLIRHALDLFDRLYTRRMLLRLVGVRLSHLVHGQYQISLFDDTEESIRLYQAMDHIKYRHGSEALIRAVTMDVNRRVRMDMNPFRG